MRSRRRQGYRDVMADQRQIGYWLALTNRLIDERFAHTLDEHGVTRRQWHLLDVLSRGPRPAAELEAELAPMGSGADAASIAEDVAELAESGWILAEDAPAGPRYAISERGSVAHDRLAEVVEAERTRVSDGVSDADRATTVAVLETVARNLGWGG